MLFSLAILLFTSPTVTAVTDLQTQCNGTDRLYNGTSCYVIDGSGKMQDAAKESCNHYPGYSGHLVHIRNAAVKAAVKQLMTKSGASSSSCAFTAMELVNSSVSPTLTTNWANYYRDGTFVSLSYLPWSPSQPSTSTANKRAMYCNYDDGIHTCGTNDAKYYVCEYEEALWQPVTDLEQKCVALASSLNPSFINGVCYALRTTYSNYNNAKKLCKDINGYDGHLAHVRTISELWVAEAFRTASNANYLWLGIEQTDLSSTDMYNGWYFTTPTGPSELTTYLPWATSYPAASKRAIGMTAGYPKSFATLSSSDDYNPFLCQYGNTTAKTTTTTSTTTTATTTKPTTTISTITPTAATAANVTTTKTPTTIVNSGGANCTATSAWTIWSACSQSCDKGIRSRKFRYNIPANCSSPMTSTPVYYYESCATGVQCKSSSTRTTTLKSGCTSKVGRHLAYSSCYFLANISGSQTTASDYCKTQGGQLASLFGEDLVSQLGSLFLQFSSVKAWIGLKYTGGKLKWMVDNAPYTLFKNVSTPPTGSECYALVADRSSQNAIENPRLSPMNCSASLQQAICMKSDHIYSSYGIKKGKKVIEAESPESASIEVDFNACGARCSEIIGCVGFNFNPSDGSCIPTKVCPAMPSVINGVSSYAVQDDSSWIFYERI
uniref:C-type lectin domain-containing protein n=1 Tax=Plectus sambesii TaxID=2011161 RepID=A0A914VYY0_9BILA